MFGFEGDEAIGLAGRALCFSDEHHDALGLVATPLLSAGKPFKTEHFLRRKDGSGVYVSQIGYVQDPDDPRAGTIWIFEDRSAALATQQALQPDFS